MSLVWQQTVCFVFSKNTVIVVVVYSCPIQGDCGQRARRTVGPKAALYVQSSVIKVVVGFSRSIQGDCGQRARRTIGPEAALYVPQSHR